jgi:hypothetical protein
MAKKKLFTYSVTCVVQIQFTFDEDQVDSDEEDTSPSSKAIAELESELLEYISQNYAVDSAEIEDGADGCLLLGIVDDDE